jgi:hypothetical protein
MTECLTILYMPVQSSSIIILIIPDTHIKYLYGIKYETMENSH